MEVTQTGEPPAPALYTQAPAYVYPGYMFGPPMYNVNGEYSLLDVPALLLRQEECRGRVFMNFEGTKCFRMLPRLVC